MSELAERLEQHMTDEFEMVDNQKERYQITTPDQAEWALKKLRKIAEKEQEVHQLVDAELFKLENFRKSEIERLANEKTFFEGLLFEYHTPKYEDDPKGNKTLRFPSGSITFKKQQPNFVRAEDDLLDWVKAHRPELVKVKESVDWANLKKDCQITVDGQLVTADGEIVEGVVVEQRPDKFEVKLG